MPQSQIHFGVVAATDEQIRRMRRMDAEFTRLVAADRRRYQSSEPTKRTRTAVQAAWVAWLLTRPAPERERPAVVPGSPLDLFVRELCT
jgi:hypothetical protein